MSVADEQHPGTAPGAEGPQPPATEPEEYEPDPRFSYANERTFLAWMRTALGLITAGLAITQLLPPFDMPGGRRLIGLPLIAMRRGLPLPRSPLPRITAVVVTIVAVIGVILVIVEGKGS